MAVIGSLLLYAFLAEFLLSQILALRSQLQVKDVRMLRYVFFGLSILSVAVLRLMRGAILRKPPEDDWKRRITKLQKSSLISLALCECPAIFGLVLLLLTGMKRDFYFLLIVSLILVFLYFPRFKNWKSWMEHQER